MLEDHSGVKGLEDERGWTKSLDWRVLVPMLVLVKSAL
jgi:hypothetical protein